MKRYIEIENNIKQFIDDYNRNYNKCNQLNRNKSISLRSLIKHKQSPVTRRKSEPILIYFNKSSTTSQNVKKIFSLKKLFDTSKVEELLTQSAASLVDLLSNASTSSSFSSSTKLKQKQKNDFTLLKQSENLVDHSNLGKYFISY